jgi:UDP-N-acetylglucosamine 2-epimerase (non-hydrolysing)
MREVLDHYRNGIRGSSILQDLGLAAEQYFVVSAHREENVDDADRLRRLVEILDGVAHRYQLPIIFSTHPRTRKRLRALDVACHPNVRLEKPFGFLDYVKLQSSARAVLSDSGTITEESAILNFPALNLREVHERPEGFEEASVMMVGLELNRVLEGLAVLGAQPRGETRLLRVPADYQTNNVSEKVLRIILSYTDFINRRVWKKPEQHRDT